MSQAETKQTQIQPTTKTVKKSISNKRLLDVYGEINRPNVVVRSMVHRVTEKGEVIVDSCEYEEVVTS